MESDKPAQLTTPINQVNASQSPTNNMSQWQLKLTQSRLHQNEHTLTLTNINTHNILRNWFGPIALHLFIMAKKHLINKPESQQNTDELLFNKVFAQHFLIEAGLYHHKCTIDFLVTHDLRVIGIEFDHELTDLLLYLRMTSLHPNQDCLRQVNAHANSCCDELEAQLETLKSNQLIQSINYQGLTFYDKNPLPHSHLFDPDKMVIVDYNVYTSQSSLQLVSV